MEGLATAGHHTSTADALAREYGRALKAMRAGLKFGTLARRSVSRPACAMPGRLAAVPLASGAADAGSCGRSGQPGGAECTVRRDPELDRSVVAALNTAPGMRIVRYDRSQPQQTRCVHDRAKAAGRGLENWNNPENAELDGVPDCAEPSEAS